MVSIDHIHMVRVSVREHAALLRQKLMIAGTASFRTLCSDCQSTLEVVARFLALLELYRDGSVSFDQVQALGELTVRWTGTEEVAADLDFDEYGDETDPSSDDSESSDADVDVDSDPDAASDAAELEPNRSPGAVPTVSGAELVSQIEPASDAAPVLTGRAAVVADSSSDESEPAPDSTAGSESDWTSVGADEASGGDEQ
jgi:segregation and condensation protein A